MSGCIFAAEACIDNRKKVLSSNISSTCPHNMVNFGLLTAEIRWRVWGTPCKFQWLSCLGSITARHSTDSSSWRQPNFAALNIGRHLYAAGRPLRWALTHFLVVFSFLHYSFVFVGSVRQIKLAIRQLLIARKYSVSHHIDAITRFRLRLTNRSHVL